MGCCVVKGLLFAGRHQYDSLLQLGLRRLETWEEHLPDISERFVKVEAHSFGPEMLAYNVELDTVEDVSIMSLSNCSATLHTCSH